MSHHGFDAGGWYIGAVADDAPGSTPIAPGNTSTTTTPGELRARWRRYMWVDQPYAAPVTPVPDSITMRQARLALLGAGMLASVSAAIDALASPAKEAAQIEWEYSHEVARNNGLVQTLAPALGLSGAQLDQLFITAATL